MNNLQDELTKRFVENRKQILKDLEGFYYIKMIKCLDKKTKDTLLNPMLILTDAIKCSANKKKFKELPMKIWKYLYPEVHLGEYEYEYEYE